MTRKELQGLLNRDPKKEPYAIVRVRNWFRVYYWTGPEVFRLVSSSGLTFEEANSSATKLNDAFAESNQ